MSGKVQVSLWLRKDLKRIVEDEEINLTQWVNDTLEKYFSVATVEDVTKEIVASKLKTIALEKRRADMIAQGVAESAESGMKNGVEEELIEASGEETVKSERERCKIYATCLKQLCFIWSLLWQNCNYNKTEGETVLSRELSYSAVNSAPLYTHP